MRAPRWRRGVSCTTNHWSLWGSGVPSPPGLVCTVSAPVVSTSVSSVAPFSPDHGSGREWPLPWSGDPNSTPSQGKSDGGISRAVAGGFMPQLIRASLKVFFGFLGTSPPPPGFCRHFVKSSFTDLWNFLENSKYKGKLEKCSIGTFGEVGGKFICTRSGGFV